MSEHSEQNSVTLSDHIGGLVPLTEPIALEFLNSDPNALQALLRAISTLQNSRLFGESYIEYTYHFIPNGENCRFMIEDAGRAVNILLFEYVAKEHFGAKNLRLMTRREASGFSWLDNREDIFDILADEIE